MFAIKLKRKTGNFTTVHFVTVNLLPHKIPNLNTKIKPTISQLSAFQITFFRRKCYRRQLL
jgi:hypothetical protein